ncbi:acyl-CoA dehydrogenase [Lentzea sp. NBRC 105346]|uniref:acyl-CoA dehydrogenase family protein n=1 Tax=Lentzea sp. NBRC 105346 TaxID=3032205 RepID=UPI0024A4F5A5|nr:acyl-CoA dehydrogenase family protein [Lentzea sp. NBRC 105346]GLZ27945.1 acyl-CoA dehydrogenase [Lentzea sp. NBRC 105346]
MPEDLTTLVGDSAPEWDRTGLLPLELLRDLGRRGLLCAQVPAEFGGLGYSGQDNGEFTAHVGGLCSSLRSVMTSQGMAAWTVQRFGAPDQRARWLPRLTGGELAAVAFSEPGAGSDLAGMGTTVEQDGDSVIVTGRKVWITVGAYADVVVVFGRYQHGAAAVIVPVSTPGVRIERIADPLGCRAAGHANVVLDAVRVPAENMLGRSGIPLPFLVTAALSYGRLSVAWGCVGILRACLGAAARHAKTREQNGIVLADHQLVAAHLADLYVAEQVATRVCEHASRCWDSESPELVSAVVTAKHVAATQAAAGASTAVQVLASAGSRDGHVVARAYRDAKLMEIIEGSNEICRTVLARHVLAGVGSGQ